jgi:hypothetical protein
MLPFMAAWANNTQRLGTFVAVAIATAVAIAALFALTREDRSPPQGDARVGPFAQLAADVAMSPGDEVFNTILKSTYQERARYDIDGETVVVFTGSPIREPHWYCVGAIRGTVSAASCAERPYRDGGVMDVYRASFGNDALFVGVAAPAVRRVAFRDATGRRTLAETHSGAFVLFGTRGQGELQAIDALGNVLYAQSVAFSR